MNCRMINYNDIRRHGIKAFTIKPPKRSNLIADNIITVRSKTYIVDSSIFSGLYRVIDYNDKVPNINYVRLWEVDPIHLKQIKIFLKTGNWRRKRSGKFPNRCIYALTHYYGLIEVKFLETCIFELEEINYIRQIEWATRNLDDDKN